MKLTFIWPYDHVLKGHVDSGILSVSQQTSAGEDVSKDVITPVDRNEICFKSAKKAMFSQICDTFRILHETVTHR